LAGLVLVLWGVVSALAPVGTQASVFITSALPATVSGAQEGGPLTFVFEGQKVTCNSSYSGTISTEAAETLTVAPTLKECFFNPGSATVEVKECKFVLHGGEEVAEAEFSGTEDVSCPAGQVILIKGATCEAKIGTQSGLAKVTYKSELSETESAKFKTAAAITGMKYTAVDGFLCPWNGGGEKTSGEMSGSALFTATNEESAAASVALSTAWISPAVKNYNAANQTTTIYWETKTPGEYKIWGQKLVDVINFEWVQKIGTETCVGVFTVIKGEVKACLFKIKTAAGAVKTSSEVFTNWSPKGAKFAQPIKSWVVYK
jgi:hypothetical protein